MTKTKQSEKLAIKGGAKTLSLKGPHYVWPPITKVVEQVALKQLHTSISIYDRSGIFEKFESAFSKYHKRKFALPVMLPGFIFAGSITGGRLS